MPFTASFSVSQSQDGSQLTLVDTSNYSVENKATFSLRRFYLNLDDGSTILADGSLSDTDPATPIDFSFAAYPSDTIIIPLKTDWGINIVFQLTSLNPQTGSVYEAQLIANLENFRKSFLQSITQGSQGQYNIQNDLPFQNSWLNYYLNIKCSENAQEFQVLSSIQKAIDRNYILSTNQNNYF